LRSATRSDRATTTWASRRGRSGSSSGRSSCGGRSSGPITPTPRARWPPPAPRTTPHAGLLRPRPPSRRRSNLRQSGPGPAPPDPLTSMTNLAVAYWDSGRRADALRLQEKHLEQTKAKLGPDHPHTLIAMGTLATSYREASRLADALPLFEETLKWSRAR